MSQTRYAQSAAVLSELTGFRIQLEAEMRTYVGAAQRCKSQATRVSRSSTSAQSLDILPTRRSGEPTSFAKCGQTYIVIVRDLEGEGTYLKRQFRESFEITMCTCYIVIFRFSSRMYLSSWPLERACVSTHRHDDLPGRYPRLAH